MNNVEITKMLNDAQLPGKLELVIGKTFIFKSEHGSHNIILIGTINGIFNSDEGGTQLLVSPQSYWGQKLISLCFNKKQGWQAYVESNDPSFRYYKGHFSIYASSK